MLGDIAPLTGLPRGFFLQIAYSFLSRKDFSLAGVKIPHVLYLLTLMVYAFRTVSVKYRLYIYIKRYAREGEL